ncbi:TetR/AcrR family transcriptional regulator C-terminal domain-containing protein [Lactobacillus sp. CC-MHH1034]|uniref:TetR/AcrR family transcriptional regulator n=1 Tax=Agrilactobacillus fermenti TaxID=2586909 RepID=UPI001E42F125|nr:TetR/AcrR family transcriptional regulator [Agrilactobacillus fermenti]MCD2256603.1 TetR/AcrR family transcriptional regulator C-terminal domain-containing protein [Agrilactobacillus fermenti]
MKFNSDDERFFLAFVLVANEAASRSEITLAKIADKLHISRQAMHQSHYRSIDELIRNLHYFIDQKPHQMVKKFIKNAHQYRLNDIIQFFGNQVLPLLYEKRHYLKVLYGRVADPAWRSFIIDHYVTLIEPFFDKSTQKVGLSANFMAQLLVSEALAIIANWMRQPEPENPVTFSQKFNYLMENHTKALIDI